MRRAPAGLLPARSAEDCRSGSTGRTAGPTREVANNVTDTGCDEDGTSEAPTVANLSLSHEFGQSRVLVIDDAGVQFILGESCCSALFEETFPSIEGSLNVGRRGVEGFS